jgi:hypothetical protein
VRDFASSPPTHETTRSVIIGDEDNNKAMVLLAFWLNRPGTPPLEDIAADSANTFAGEGDQQGHLHDGLGQSVLAVLVPLPVDTVLDLSTSLA